MSRNDLVAYLARSPFEPFRIVTTDGTNYDVRHPDMVIAAPTSAVVGYPDPDVAHAFLRFDLVSMRHIIRLEQIPEEAGAENEGNGAAQT